MKIMEFQKKYLLWRMDFSEPLRIPDFRVLETGKTGDTHAIFKNELIFEMRFLIGLFICFVLSLCGFALVNE